VDAVIGLGSNLGDRLATLARARVELGTLGTLTAASSLYETAPVGPPQPMFLNAAVALTTSVSPPGLLAALLAVEQHLGRVRRERWGPRTIDLDILWIAGTTWDSPELTVPHPELRSRAFALRPLLDVAPAATDPRDGTSYRSVLAALGAESGLEIVGSPVVWA
jgi:2-amino-4-hydroxy-6-hydroxymethyldihydropteridine diphosphokinase